MTHYTTETSTFTGASGTFTVVDHSVLKLADSLEMTVRIPEELNTTGIDEERGRFTDLPGRREVRHPSRHHDAQH